MAKTAGILFPLTPSFSPKEREKHLPLPWYYDGDWLSCAAEAKDKEAGSDRKVRISPRRASALPLLGERGRGWGETK